MDSALTLHVSQEGHTTVVQAVGEVDVATAPQLEECLLTAVREGSSVRLDLTDVGFMDSTGVGAVLHAHHAAQVFFVTIAVTAASPQVDRVLRLSGLAKLVGLPDD
jgi:anti-anti-sigma factor